MYKTSQSLTVPDTLSFAIVDEILSQEGFQEGERHIFRFLLKEEGTYCASHKAKETPFVECSYRHSFLKKSKNGLSFSYM